MASIKSSERLSRLTLVASDMAYAANNPAFGKLEIMSADPADFSSPLLRIQHKPPASLAGWMLWVVVAPLAGALRCAALGPLYIIVVAEGKLAPASYQDRAARGAGIVDFCAGGTHA